MSKQAISLDQVVTDFILSVDHDDYVNNASEVLLRNLALRGIREMGFDVMKRIKSTTLVVNANNTVTLPDDFVDYTKIGHVGSDGLVYVFGENKNFNLVGDPIDINNDIQGDYGSYLFANYVYSSTNGRMYGLGGGFYSGQFRTDYENNRIELGSDCNFSNVVIEYVADEALATNPTIHVYAEQALRAYIYFHLVEKKGNIPQSEKARARHEYYNERRLANSRLKAFSKEEALKVIRKNFKQSPKG